MRKDYKTVKQVSFQQKKEYMFMLCENSEKLLDCYHEKQGKQFLNDEVNYDDFYQNAIKHLYQSQSYDEVEYQLIMMNVFFNHSDYQIFKQRLMRNICQEKITLNEYCVLRHLITDMSFKEVLTILHQHYHVDAEECAKICLLEDQNELAYVYLKQLNECNNDAILSLLCSYSLGDYVRLISHYHKKKKVYQWALMR